jgi:hypothetical protein
MKPGAPGGDEGKNLGKSLVERTAVILVFVLITKTCGTVVENCCDINRKRYNCVHVLFFSSSLELY